MRPQNVFACVYMALKRRSPEGEFYRNALRKLRAAHKFAIEPGIDIELFKGAQDFADQLAENGLLRLPYPICALTFGPIRHPEISQGQPFFFSLLAWEQGEKIHGHIWDVHLRGVGNGLMEVAIPRNMRLDQFRDELGHIISTAPHLPASAAQDPIEHGTLGLFGGFLYGLVGMLNSDGIETVEGAPEKKFINAKREARGEPPLFSVSTLKVDFASLKIPGTACGDRTHATPRLHWRRGHIRKLQSGKLTIVRPCLVGDVTRGSVEKTYRLAS